jgi:hypothetical protein
VTKYTRKTPLRKINLRRFIVSEVSVGSIAAGL